MKIGILIDELISGGFQKVALMEAKYLKKLGHDVSLVILHKIKIEGYIDLIKNNNINVIYISDRLPCYLKINFRFPFFAFFSFMHIFYPFFIYKYIRKNEFDIFITHGTYTAFSSIRIKKKIKIPYICFVHDPITYIINQKYKDKFLGNFSKLLTPIAKKLDKMIIKNATSVFAFPDMIDEMKKTYPDYPHYYEIFNGCESIDQDDVEYGKRNYCISVTKWDQGKNFELLIEIWKKLSNRIPLKVVGSFSPVKLEKDYRRKIKENSLSEYIEIIGKVSETELINYYKNAKFLIHPCREAFGMTILEASANGCPAIFTRNSGVARLYPKFIKTKLPNENDLMEYINIINYFIKVPEQEYRVLVNDYYKTAKENSWENHCKKINTLIQRL